MTRQYKITAFDESVAAVASRFGIAHPSIIYDMNPDVFDSGGNAYVAIEPRFIGITLQLPDDPSKELHDWVSYTAKAGETLDAICQKKNKDRRIDPSRKGKGVPTPPWLAPEYLLNLYENADVRAGHGPDASKVSLAKGEIVMIPFPKSSAGAKPIAATPNGKNKVDVHPAWIDEIDNWVKSLQSRTRQFESSMTSLRYKREQGMKEIQVLLAAKAVLALEIDHPAGGPDQVGKDIAGMKRFGQVLDDLTNTAMDEMFAKITKYVAPKLQHDTEVLGDTIVSDLHGADLKRLTGLLMKVADRYPRTTNELSWALCYAYQTLADSSLADQVRPDVEAAAKFLAGLKKINVDGLRSVDPNLARAIQSLPAVGNPMDPLSNLISLLGVTGSSVGNLPGPSTLAVAMIRLKALQNGARHIAAQQSQTVWTLSIEEQAVFVAMSVNGMTTTEAEGADLLIIVGKVRTATLARTPLNPQSFDSKFINSYLREIDNSVQEGVMATPRWLRGMTFFNVLIAGLAAYDMWGNGGQTNVAGALSVSMGAVTAFSGAMKMMGKLVVGEFAARAVAAIGAVYSGYQAAVAFKEGDTAAGVLNAAAALGSALLVASCFLAPFPFLAAGAAAIGGFLVVASNLALIIRDLLHSSTSRWWEGLQKAVEDGDVFTIVKAKAPALTAKLEALKASIKQTTFLLIDTSQSEALGRLVPQGSLSMLLASDYEPPQFPMM